MKITALCHGVINYEKRKNKTPKYHIIEMDQHEKIFSNL